MLLLYCAWISVASWLAFNFVFDAIFAGSLVAYKPNVKRTAVGFLSGLSSYDEEVFEKQGINLPIKTYNVVRNSITLLFLFSILASAFKLNISDFTKEVAFFLIFYLVSTPKEYTSKGKKTIFKKILDMVAKAKRDKKDLELLTIIAQMKNLILSSNTNEISADYLLTRLIVYTKYSRPNFIQALGALRRSDRAKVYSIFKNDFGTDLGESFGRILTQLDFLPATEFLDQLTTLQRSAKDFRSVKMEKVDLAKKVALTLSVSVLLTLIIFNYLALIMLNLFDMMRYMM